MMPLDTLIQNVAAYSDAPDVAEVLTTTFQIVSEAHHKYQRISGEPFLSHPVAVASTLAEWHAPLPIVAVGLLHDILNFTYSDGYDLEEIRQKLGAEIVHLLEAAISLNSIMRELESKFDEGADLITIQQNMASVLLREQDVVVIKIADRLHNLQTIASLARFFQERAARIGFNLLAPLAYRLGMGMAKRQLEDYCFDLFNTTAYKKLRQHSLAAPFQQEIQAVQTELQLLLQHMPRQCEVRWQADSLYTLYYQQISQNAKLGKSIRADPSSLRLIDAGSFIILTEEETDCYQILGVLHRHLAPVERTFRDFIGQGKENGYRSLHTQVKHASGHPLRIIIRTRPMDLVAERGITARWWRVTEELLPQLPRGAKAVDEEIQVFTSNGKIMYLPQDATVLDFAYAIHTSVGHRCVGALVNGEHADVYQALRVGDRIEIIAGSADTPPLLNWLEHVRTSQAANQIRIWLTQNQRNAMLERGQHLLDKELQALGLSCADADVRQLLLVQAVKEGLERIEDFLVSIGVGRRNASKVVEQLKSRRLKSPRAPNYGDLNFRVNALAPEDALLPLTFARCCRPVPPDEIVGCRRDDHTLVIHTRACIHIKDLERLVLVEWDISSAESHYVVVVEALNRPGLASDLSTIMALSGTDMASFSASRRADGVMAQAHIELHRTTTSQRARLQQELERIPYVTNIEIIPSSFFAPALREPDATRPTYQPNPYGLSIASGPRFYGREVECQRISALLCDPSQNTTLLLWGQKRIGKTSLMLRLQEHTPGDFLPVYLDVQGYKDSTTAQFLHHMMSRISLAYKEKNTEDAQEISVPALNKLRKDPLSYFDTFMDRLQQMRYAWPLVVILDEFQCLCSLREEMLSRDAIFSRLRSRSLHEHGVRFILSGGGLRSQLTGQCDMTSLFNIAHDFRLGCLERAAAYQLIADGLSSVGNITEQAIELLLDLTAGHPFYLQLLCCKLYEQAYEHHKPLNDEVVSQSVNAWLNTADNSRFQHLWEGYDKASAQRHKLILSVLAELTATERRVSYERVAQTLCLSIAEHDLVQSLDDLADLGILEHSQASYTITIELFARWLRQHWPLELTRKEMDRV